MLYHLKNDDLDIVVNTVGAELHGIEGEDGTQYLWSGNPAFWAGRATNLFPVCGRLWGGSYSYDGKSYSLPIHGFARSMEFVTLEHTSESLTLELTDNDETLAMYPFPFRLTAHYSLCGSGLVCTLRTENTGGTTLPFSVGGHPGFNIPLAPGLRFEDYRLDFGEECSPRRMLITPDGYCAGGYAPYPLESGRIIRLNHHLFERDGVFLTDTPDTVTIKSDLDARSVTLRCGDMTCLGLWHTSGSEAPFVCVEPWHGQPSTRGVTDDLGTKAGIIKLPAGDAHDFTYEIKIKQE